MKRLLVALVVTTFAMGCRAPEESTAVVVADARYRVSVRNAPAPSLDADGKLHLRVEAINGWHIAAEAPARLGMQAASSLSFEPPELRQADARRFGEDGFEFVMTVGATSAGPTVAHGRLKFGICEDTDAKCIIVRRDLEIPIEVTSGG